MDKFDRFQRFHRILTTRRRPVPLLDLAEELECSTKTVQRTIEQMRDYWQAPIEYSREYKGYYYSDDKRDVSPQTLVHYRENWCLPSTRSLIRAASLANAAGACQHDPNKPGDAKDPRW